VEGVCRASRVSGEVIDDEYDDCPCDDLPQHVITSSELPQETATASEQMVALRLCASIAQCNCQRMISNPSNPTGPAGRERGGARCRAGKLDTVGTWARSSPIGAHERRESDTISLLGSQLTG
jgi:hypothetical protein